MSDSAPAKSSSPRTLEGPDPLIIDLGKHRRKDVKQLRQGAGPLVDEIASCLGELRESGQIAANAQPVVIVVRERKKKGLRWPLDS
jgi:Family of unknown function (DUF6200)